MCYHKNVDSIHSQSLTSYRGFLGEIIMKISFKDVGEQVVMTYPCKVALVYCDGDFAGLKLCKRIEDDLYFLQDRHISDFGAIYYKYVDGSSTKSRDEIKKFVRSWVQAKSKGSLNRR
jgi:hypothetical protein